MLINYRILGIIGLILILIIAGLFSFLETAIVAVSEYKLNSLKERYAWARYSYSLKKQLNQVLIFSLFGNSLFNSIFATSGTLLIGYFLSMLTSNGIVFPIGTLLASLLIILFSEALPKIVAARAPVSTLKLIGIPLYYVFQISKPIVWLLDKILFYLTVVFKSPSYEAISVEDLKEIISDIRIPIKKKHRSILLNSVGLEDIAIKEVLIPLRMVEGVDVNSDIEVILKKLYSTHHTRIIVYSDHIDNIVGYVHVKDVVLLGKQELNKMAFCHLIRSITYINDFVSITKQINRAQKYRSRIYAVVNEYGDISGIACLEDMLEIIFGDFTTVSPKMLSLEVKNEDGDIIVNGAMLVRELNELYDLNITFDMDSLTINGLVLKFLNGIPSVGVSFVFNGLIFEVLEVGIYWVEKVKISVGG